MKAISLWQPWASLVAYGIKDRENRSWPTNYRGPLLIHAAKRWDDGALLEVKRWIAEGIVKPTKPLPTEWPEGVLVGCAILEDCRMHKLVGNEPNPWHMPGCWGWHLTHAIGFRVPIPIRGRQRIFNVSEDQTEAQGQALGAASIWNYLDNVYRNEVRR